jgi:hypothetical protein
VSETSFDAHKQCCFCGANNENGVTGYGGERQCVKCGHGGEGEPDSPQMAYKMRLSTEGA